MRASRADWADGWGVGHSSPPRGQQQTHNFHAISLLPPSLLQRVLVSARLLCFVSPSTTKTTRITPIDAQRRSDKPPLYRSSPRGTYRYQITTPPRAIQCCDDTLFTALQRIKYLRFTCLPWAATTRPALLRAVRRSHSPSTRCCFLSGDSPADCVSITSDLSPPTLELSTSAYRPPTLARIHILSKSDSVRLSTPALPHPAHQPQPRDARERATVRFDC